MKKKFRIGIIGSENSHAGAFMNIFNKENIYDDIEVVAVGGIDSESNQKLFEEYNLEFIAEKPEDMLGKVDAVMITARDGKYHAQFAKPFIEAGIPAFIDKPFTVNKQEAVDLLKTAKEKGVPVCGGSSLKNCYDVLMLKNEFETNKDKILTGTVTAPVNTTNPYSGFFFYSSHLAEISLAVFGYDPLSVTAIEKNGSIVATVEYDNFCVANCFASGCYQYHGQVVSNKRIYARNIDESMCYKHECEEFVEMLRTGKMKFTYAQLIAPVFYLNAIYDSYTTGQKVEIEKFEI
ncbi:MAG: Gfo/Idh/MocA family oxidoreductase [Clostridia bacterium]|nr:Gfo/Idh/MocA family oxidoreductase [Clostridia bacterium]